MAGTDGTGGTDYSGINEWMDRQLNQIMSPIIIPYLWNLIHPGALEPGDSDHYQRVFPSW